MADSFVAAIGIAGTIAIRQGHFTVMIAGGAEVYAQAMEIATRLEITGSPFA